MENNNLKNKLKGLHWRIDFLNEAYPDLVLRALQSASADVDYYLEEGDEPITLDWVFSRDKQTVRAFFDELTAEFPYGAGPVLNSVARELGWLSEQVADGTITDFNLLSQAWFHNPAEEVQLFEPLDLYKLSKSLNGTDSVAERLTTNGPWKSFGFDDGTLQRLEELSSKTPNFTEVIDCIMDAVTLATRYNRPIRVTPILMVGEPGIGKSYFTDQLSKCLSVPLTRISVDNLQIGSDLAGSSYVYSKSSPGAVFRVLTDESHISPVVILDELDKVPPNWGYGDPLGPLHNLLEPVSAKVFKDASFPIPIDASHVIWIATANNLSSIPATIRSRFEVCKVAPPTESEFDAILREICQELESQYPGVSINNNVNKTLRGKTPREQRQLLQRAVARAIRLDDSCVSDWHVREVMGHGKPGPRLAVVQEPTGYL